MSSRSRLRSLVNAAFRVLSLRARLRELALTSQLVRAIRVMGPTLIVLSFAGVAQAQGTMDFTGATTLMGTFKTFAVFAGAVICLAV